MKIAQNNRSVRAKKAMVPPVIPFEKAKEKEYQANELFKVKIHTNPADDESPMFSKAIPYYDTGTNEEWLLCRKGLREVVQGLNLTAGPDLYRLTRQVLKGAALRSFNQAANEHGAESVAHYNTCLMDVTGQIFPLRAAQTQKRYLRRGVRKQRDVGIRMFVARCVELNEYLEMFPDGTRMDDVELLDILEHAIPNSWQKTMLEQGFVPVESTIHKFLNFCERQEQAERLVANVREVAAGTNNRTDVNTGRNGGKRKQGSTTNAEPTVSSNKRSRRDAYDPNKYCPYHDCRGHDLNECEQAIV